MLYRKLGSGLLRYACSYSLIAFAYFSSL